MKRVKYIALVLFGIMAVTALIDRNFLTPYNISNILRWTGLFGILSIGVSFVIMTGGIDLSVGSIVGLVGALSTNFIRVKGFPIPLVLLLCIGFACLLGLFHGFFITELKVQPFVVTLCGLFIYRGITRFTMRDITQGYGSKFQNLKLLATGEFPAIFWGKGKVPAILAEWSLPMPFIILITMGVLFGILLKRSIYGRYVLGVGSNEEALKYSGIKTKMVKVAAYMISAGCAGFAGILFSLDLNTVQPSTAGNMYELYAIAGCVIGGVSLKGGEGTILGVILGTAIVRILYNSINFLGITTTLEFAIIGSVILFGASAEEILTRLTRRKKLEDAIREIEAGRKTSPEAHGSLDSREHGN